MRKIIGAAVILGLSFMLFATAFAAELVSEDRGFNWQDREYFGRAYTERQLGGGDAAAGDAGDGGAAAGASGGASGGDSGGNGDGCGR